MTTQGQPPAGWQVAPRTPNDVTAELAGGGYLVRLTVGHNQLTLNRPEAEAIIERLEAVLPRLPIELAPR